MGRVINPDSLGKRRNQLMRTSAEMLRHLSQKQEIDEEARDMLALLVFTLREIADGIRDSTLAWEKRNYWVKIEKFEQKWDWTDVMAKRLESLILAEDWHNLHDLMLKLFPKFADIKVNKFTRKETEWLGRYEQLLQEQEIH